MEANPFTIFLLITIFCLTHVQCTQDNSTICPLPQMILPCICNKPYYSKDVFLTCDGVLSQNALLQALENSTDYAYTKLELRHCFVEYLPVSVLPFKYLTRITIFSTTMASLFDSIPPEDNVLDKVELENMRFSNGLIWEQFQTLLKLREVKIKNMPVRYIGQNFAENIPPSVEVVAFFDNDLERLDGGAMATLYDLKLVTFQGQQLKDLKRSLFPFPAKLTDMDFSRNNIVSLPADFFIQMPDLKSVTLDNNLITLISEDVYRHLLPQLDNLYLFGNPLSCRCYLRWILEAEKENVYLSGNCEEPKKLQGRDLMSLRTQDFNHCQ